MLGELLDEGKSRGTDSRILNADEYKVEHSITEEGNFKDIEITILGTFWTIPNVDKNVTYVEWQGIITTKDGEDTATFRGYRYGIGHSKGQVSASFRGSLFINHQYQQMENFHFWTTTYEFWKLKYMNLEILQKRLGMEIIMIMISQFNIIVVIIVLTSILNFVMIDNYYHGLDLIYAQQTIGSNNSSNNIIKLDSIPSKQVKVGDMGISYKIFGKGDPILLIMGYAGSMYGWDPVFLKGLSTNHTVIVFDNRGIGNTTVGSKNFTIDQFAKDSAGLLDALKINESDVLRYSMGGMIAQQLTLNYPDKVDNLIIYASYCGGKQSIPPNPEWFKQMTNLSSSADDIKKRIVPLLFTSNWIKQHPDYLEKFASFVFPSIDILERQGEAVFSWEVTCDQLKDISQDTLVVTGTDDLVLSSVNSMNLIENIPGAWLAQFKEGGHALMFQYPERLSVVVNIFLEN